MKLFMTETTERLSVPPAVCAQVSGVRPGSASQVARETVAGPQGVRVRLAADAPQLPRVHQALAQAATAAAQARPAQPAPAQAQQASALAGVTRPVQAWSGHTADSYGTKGTNGSRAKDTLMGMKLIDGVSGAPPRGRPV